MQKHKVRKINLGPPPLRPEPPAKPEPITIVELQALEIQRLAAHIEDQDKHIGVLRDRNAAMVRMLATIRNAIAGEGAILTPAQTNKPAKRGKGL
jgi:hypothetical protein